MDGRTYTISKTHESGTDNSKNHNRSQNSNWRLKQAIDILLDYMLQLDEKSLIEGQHSENESGLAF